MALSTRPRKCGLSSGSNLIDTEVASPMAENSVAKWLVATSLSSFLGHLAYAAQPTEKQRLASEFRLAVKNTTERTRGKTMTIKVKRERTESISLTPLRYTVSLNPEGNLRAALQTLARSGRCRPVFRSSCHHGACPPRR